ncbi:hypothetical protein NIES2100_62150 [Calothrix sp. NIES-2100]|nr:hypothetical protein NIES2100_62150 [Calothrix sp. NIES-2100]
MVKTPPCPPLVTFDWKFPPHLPFLPLDYGLWTIDS